MTPDNMQVTTDPAHLTINLITTDTMVQEMKRSYYSRSKIIEPGKYLALLCMVILGEKTEEYVVYNSSTKEESYTARRISIARISETGVPNILNSARIISPFTSSHFNSVETHDTVYNLIFNTIPHVIYERVKVQAWMKSSEIARFVDALCVPAIYSSYVNAALNTSDCLYLVNLDRCRIDGGVSIKRFPIAYYGDVLPLDKELTLYYDTKDGKLKNLKDHMPVPPIDAINTNGTVGAKIGPNNTVTAVDIGSMCE